MNELKRQKKLYKQSSIECLDKVPKLGQYIGRAISALETEVTTFNNFKTQLTEAFGAVV